MPTVTIRPSGKTVNASAGENLLDVIVATGEACPQRCLGRAECGACHLFVLEGCKSLSKIQRVEDDKLDTLVGVGPRSRLACQAMLGDADVTVELPGQPFRNTPTPINGERS
jgi:ferredoxin, 2Fe-2S